MAGTARKEGDLVGMVGGVMAMRVTRRLLMLLAILVAVPMFGDFLGNQSSVPRSFSGREGQRFMGRGQRQGSEDQRSRQDGHGQFPSTTVKGGP